MCMIIAMIFLACWYMADILGLLGLVPVCLLRPAIIAAMPTIFNVLCVVFCVY